MKSFTYAVALLASSSYGHVQMSNPFPIRSPLDTNSTGQKDYSYTNPLSTSGSDYPCKGYAKDPFNAAATYAPGSEYTLELQGSATHGGGSCQIALSYDQGESFSVIHSILGGCPLTKKSYQFTIPADAPSGEALLSWTWFNKVGNREMYMNCAQVTIGGSGARKDGFTEVAKSEAFSSLPPIFIANVNGPGQCTTTEGEEVNFPLPGPSIEGSLSGTGYKCSGTAPFLGSSNSPNDSTGTGAGSTSTSTSTPIIQSPATPSTSPSGTPSTSTPTTVSTERPLPAGQDGPCSPGTIICADDGASWWLCNQGKPVHMGLVAPGTHCVHGAMQRVE
ncbi:putative extracellular protein [Aspergillus undulatus]|uniref:putative extracellular protein n=1 Tax=Aspergillus undulatus TaxID=1810928 RepID=UPI003CCD993A